MTLARITAVLAIACAAVTATSHLPTDPTTASGLCIVTGTTAGWLADMWLPRPTTRTNRPGDQ